MKRRNNRNENVDNQVKPLLRLKPKFNLFAALSTKYLGTLITLIFIGILIVQNSSTNILLVTAVIGLYVLYLVVMLLILKRKYKKTSYLFFEDCILIAKKYGNKEQILVPYTDIEDILFYQNYAQKLLKMGSLGVKTRSGNIFNKIVMLDSLQDLYGTIEKIKPIIYGDI